MGSVVKVTLLVVEVEVDVVIEVLGVAVVPVNTSTVMVLYAVMTLMDRVVVVPVGSAVLKTDTRKAVGEMRTVWIGWTDTSLHMIQEQA